MIDAREVPNFKKDGDAEEASDKERPSVVSVNPFTIIAATDQPGQLKKKALHERFANKVELSYYNAAELKEIVQRIAGTLNMLMSPQAARLVATVSAGLPRRAKHHLQRLRLHFADSETTEVGTGRVKRYLKDNGIDELGLGRLDRRYLDYLAHADMRVSLRSLANYLGTDEAQVRDHMEPLLVRHRLIEISSGGRGITQAGRTWMQTHASK